MQNIKGTDHELAFWKQFVQSDRFINGWLSNEKTPELNDLVYMFLKGQPDAKVLDCGSGVVSILHGTVKNLTPCDLLGNEYAEFFDYKAHGIPSPFPSSCEDLKFKQAFDIVHISNAFDHVQDPNKAFDAMYRAVKPGGFLIIQGFTNEGTHEDWHGMHQWNLYLKDGDLFVDSKSEHYFSIMGDFFSTTIHLDMLERDWFIFILRKEPLEV